MKNNKNIFRTLFIFCYLLAAWPLFAANQVQGIRIWPSPDNTRVVFDLKEAAEHNSFSLDKPDRLVIDLRDTSGGSQLPNITGESALIKAIRSSGDNNSMRIVLDLSKNSQANVFTLPPTAPYGHRLVVDLPDKLPEQFIPPPAIRAARDIIIAIDAGHGGEDPGSIGPSGYYEKNITLPLAKRLLALINAQAGMKAMLVRTNDYYVHVNRRTEIARGQQADLLISIHADAFTSPQPRGASVWVLSLRRATTEVGRMLEQTERHSELLGGVAEIIKDSANERYLAQTVLDLSMNHSMTTAHQVANQVLQELEKVAYLHKSKPQAASLGVLKSPDIPSILVEVGFISNPQEEKQLRSANHQHKLAQAMFKAVKRHFEQAPPADSLFALHRARQHKVSAGESLSVLAQRYQVSVADLRQHNQLSNDSIRVGQVLRIP
ncbi:N-acetylmuramoyl-L-alanine amidase [Rheinheimera salexigens]|uniref:N-acetylmuramoyl-L-alanine amidase n=1 Tax=Rheinheimera salexigens TaxID=1628148 RepID=A0A1E7Q9E3_9GAMM|nr:N-acetylmuramoyl-L-alanine amidase [Rheinheimera salexigens]OEY70750.1 N-acetylmuramoyl-L-alanine amidase [Rheinheimera salexigens]